MPEEPRQGRLAKLKGQFGERLACGLVGALAVGGICFSARDGEVWIGLGIGALVSFALGALLGEKLLDSIR
jgi:hypothetical protein